MTSAGALMTTPEFDPSSVGVPALMPTMDRPAKRAALGASVPSMTTCSCSWVPPRMRMVELASPTAFTAVCSVSNVATR